MIWTMPKDPYDHVVELNIPHLMEMRKILIESGFVSKCANDMCNHVLRGGLALFMGGKRVWPIPKEAEMWLAHKVQRFCRDIIWNLACYGIVIWEQDPSNYSLRVVNLELVRVSMIIPPYGEPRYVVQNPRLPMMMPDPWTHDPHYHMWVTRDLDPLTGITMGHLTAVWKEYVALEITMYADLMAACNNAHPVVYLECPDPDKRKPFAGPGFRRDEPFGGETQEEMLEKRADMMEAIYKQSRALANDTEMAPTLLPGIMTNLNIPKFNVTSTKRDTIPPGHVVKQREYAPRSNDLVRNLTHYQRNISLLFCIPPNIGERRTGNKEEVQETEEDQMAQAVEQYVKILDAILYNISGELFKQFRRKRRQMSEESKELDEVVEDGWEIRLLPSTSLRDYADLYQNEVLKDKEFKRTLVERKRVLEEELREEDGREIIAERGASGGPGRKGAMTLSGAPKKQRQSRNHSGQARKAAAPHAK